MFYVYIDINTWLYKWHLKKSKDLGTSTDKQKSHWKTCMSRYMLQQMHLFFYYFRLTSSWFDLLLEELGGTNNCSLTLDPVFNLSLFPLIWNSNKFLFVIHCSYYQCLLCTNTMATKSLSWLCLIIWLSKFSVNKSRQ